MPLKILGVKGEKMEELKNKLAHFFLSLRLRDKYNTPQGAVELAEKVIAILPPPVETLGFDEIKIILEKLNKDNMEVNLFSFEIEEVAKALAGKIEKKQGKCITCQKTLSECNNKNSPHDMNDCTFYQPKQEPSKESLSPYKTCDCKPSNTPPPPVDCYGYCVLCGGFRSVKNWEYAIPEPKTQRIEPLSLLAPDNSYKMDMIMKINELYEAINQMGEKV